MIPSTATYTTKQSALGREPSGKVLIKDYAKLIGKQNDDETMEIGGASSQALATKFTTTNAMTVDHIKLFVKSDDAVNSAFSVEIREASANMPGASAISNGTGKVINFTNQSIGWQKVHFRLLLQLIILLSRIQLHQLILIFGLKMNPILGGFGIGVIHRALIGVLLELINHL